MGYIKVISVTDMDYTAKLTPLGSSILNHKAPNSSETIISVLKGVAGEARSAAIGTAIGWIFGGK